MPAAIAVFNGWATAWLRGEEVSLADGLSMAIARRAVMKDLIASDPKTALAAAVPRSARAHLPPEILDQLEQPIDTFGELQVIAVCSDNASRVDRWAVLGHRRYEAYVYGRRLETLSKTSLPVHGIALDDWLAISERPYRPLEPAELDPSPRELTVAVGDTQKRFATAADLTAWEQRIATAEASPDPNANGIIAAEGATDWVYGSKRVLFIRAEFPDDRGAAATDQTLLDSMTEVNRYYQEVSRRRTSFSATILPQSVVLPKLKSYYASNQSSYTEISDVALAAAKAYDVANGSTGAYDPDKCDRWVVLFKTVPQFGFTLADDGSMVQWAGMGVVGAKGLWLNGWYGDGILAHELGHNHGLWHSHGWWPSGSSPIGAGSHKEYADMYDVMGNGALPGAHFNAKQKTTLQYLADSEVATVTTSGTYRLNNTDAVTAAGIQALHINAGRAYDYWIEFRAQDPNSWYPMSGRLHNGVLIHWGTPPKWTNGTVGTYLLDMTPGSDQYWNDAPLGFEERFVDADYGITISPVNRGSGGGSEWIDVRVDFGATGTNHNPSLQLNVPALTARTHTDVIFTASATDVDGDPITYRWDFGDDAVVPSTNSVTHRWSTGGKYTVTCTVIDGRGGIATKSAEIVIDDPYANWTRCAAGATSSDFFGVTYADGRFIAVGTSGAIFVSGDAEQWTKAAAPSVFNLTGVTSGAGQYVAAGYYYNGSSQYTAIATSTNGAEWTDRSPSIAGALARVAYGAGRWVAVGGNGLVLYSSDAKTWVAAKSPVTAGLRAIAFANGRFIAVGDNSTILSSLDGVLWQNASVSSWTTLAGVIFRDGKWIAVGYDCWQSSDGISWRNMNAQLEGQATLNSITDTGAFLVAGTWGDKVMVSDDAISWRALPVTTAPSGASMEDTAAGNGLIVVVGTRGQIYKSGTAVVAPPTFASDFAATTSVSPDRLVSVPVNAVGFARIQLVVNGTVVDEATTPNPTLSWSPQQFGRYAVEVRGTTAAGAVFSNQKLVTVGLPNWQRVSPRLSCGEIRSIAYGNGRWWAVGDFGQVVTSNDGVSWTPVSPLPGLLRCTAVATDGRRVVVTTDPYDRVTNTWYSGLWTTTDGTAWQNIEGMYSGYTVAYSNGLWVAATGAGILTSTDGLNWTTRIFGSTQLTSLAYGNGRWIGVGWSGKAITSTDGVAWTNEPAFTTASLLSVAFVGGHWVASSYNGVGFVSDDGLAWRQLSFGIQSTINAVTAWSGQFVAVGSTSAVLTSADGAAWTPVKRASWITLQAVAASSDRLVVAGVGANIESGPKPSALSVCDPTPRIDVNVVAPLAKRVLLGTGNTDWLTTARCRPIAEASVDSWASVSFDRQPSGGCYAIAQSGGRFVGVGTNGDAFTSTDGANWALRPTGTSTNFTGIAASADLFVAVLGAAQVVTSPDGVTWTVRSTPTSNGISAIAYGSSMFVAAGGGGVIVTSPDGLAWTVRASGTTADLRCIGWSQRDGFVIGTNDGAVLRSRDGIQWSRSIVSAYQYINSVVATPFGIVVTGYNGAAWVSGDGATWVPVAIPDASVTNVAYANGAIWAAGYYGALVRHPLAVEPVFTTQPAARSVTAGQGFALNVEAVGGSALKYQWYRNGAAITAATNATYSVSASTADDEGTYTVIATDALGHASTSDPVNVNVSRYRLSNLSIRSFVNGGDTLTVGFGTSGPRTVLVRGIGPSLIDYGVPAPNPDPRLELYSNGQLIDANDNWTATSGATFPKVGAFPLTIGSKDAALVRTIDGGGSAVLRTNGSGEVLVEIYDAGTGYTPRLSNVSAINLVGPSNILTTGFVVEGNTPLKLLIRGIGPKLGSYGVAAPLSDPRLELFDHNNAKIASNDNWSAIASDKTALLAAFTATGAFQLDAGSKDAALLVTLAPGLYTAQILSADGSTGQALVEVYEVP